jgi:hypothetical protein
VVNMAAIKIILVTTVSWKRMYEDKTKRLMMQQGNRPTRMMNVNRDAEESLAGIADRTNTEKHDRLFYFVRIPWGCSQTRYIQVEQPPVAAAQ